MKASLDMVRFVRESNLIEGIHRDPTYEEIEEFDRFMNLDTIDIGQLQRFVDVYQPGAVLRNKPGLDVRVGAHYPLRGGWEVEAALKELLTDVEYMDPWLTHARYETLHPFTDCNGRSGRALWAWQMGPYQLQLGFLHRFYYQTLQSVGR